MTVQFLKTPSGDELVVLPREEYEALLVRIAEIDADEDAADVAMYDAIKARLVVALPAEVSAAMLRGESLLKAIRSWRGLTPSEIEALTGIGQDYLNDLESGRRKGGSEICDKLSAVYAVPRDWLES